MKAHSEFLETSNMAAQTMSDKSLKTTFEEALKNYDEIEKGNLAPDASQALILKTINLLEESTRLINVGQVFSSNEMLEEVQTDCIQYLAAPALLGLLVLQIQNNERAQVLETAEIYLKDFLERGQEYGIVPDSVRTVATANNSGNIDLTRIVTDRNEKIKKFLEQKQLLAELVELKSNLERADEEVRRKYFTNFVKSFVFRAEEELKSIAMEKPLAEMLKKDRDAGVDKKKPRGPPPKPLKPVVIFKNEFQKKVFGAGYPSLPTMTVDEFYEDRVKQGIFPAEGSNYSNSLQKMEDPEYKDAMDEEDKTRKEVAEENDDEEALERARSMDEFKDTHRRGWGNRYNRS